MNEDIKIASSDINKLLDIEIENHDGGLRGESKKGQSYEDGFVDGLKHAKENLVVAAQVISIQKDQAKL